MKLLFFISSLSSGGAERVVANLANHWGKKGWQVTVVTLTAQDNDFYALHSSVKRIALNLIGESSNAFIGLWSNLRRIMALRKVLQKIQPEFALGVMTTSNIILALAAWGLSSMRAFGSEHTYPPCFPLGTLWERFRRCCYGRLEGVTALTCESRDWLVAQTNVRKVPIIPNAMVWPLPMQNPRVAPDSIRSSERSLLLAVGRLNVYKGFDGLIAVFTNLASKHPYWDLVILGEGPQKTKLENQVRAAKLEKRVFFPGCAGNIGEWYEQANLYVMTSRFEGFPNTLIEALAYGLPAVSFDCDTGPRDIIRPEVDGLLVSPGDLVALENALHRLMGDGVLRQRFSERAVEARDRFSIERIAGMWEQLFEETRT
jgi:glycosyltransferase involved in cell wall biosynthesis